MAIYPFSKTPNTTASNFLPACLDSKFFRTAPFFTATFALFPTSAIGTATHIDAGPSPAAGSYTAARPRARPRSR